MHLYLREFISWEHFSHFCKFNIAFFVISIYTWISSINRALKWDVASSWQKSLFCYCFMIQHVQWFCKTKLSLQISMARRIWCLVIQLPKFILFPQRFVYCVFKASLLYRQLCICSFCAIKLCLFESWDLESEFEAQVRVSIHVH